MKVLKNFHLVFLIILVTVAINISQPKTSIDLVHDLKTKIQIAHNTGNTNLLNKAIGICDRVLSAEQGNKYAQYYKLYAQYRLISNLSQKNPDQAFRLIDEALESASNIQNAKAFSSEMKTVLAGIYMMKLSKDKTEAATISGKIHGLLDEAEQLDPNNPRAYLIRGIMLFNTPKFFGGDKDAAIQSFRKAINLLKNNKEKENSELSPQWGLLDAHAWLGIALTSKGKYTEAKMIYKKALSIAPKFAWIKYSLLPSLEKKMNSTTSKKSHND